PDVRVTEVARITADVVDDLGLAVNDDPPDQAGAALDPAWPGQVGARAGGRTDDEVSGGLLAEEDRERGAGHVPFEDGQDPRRQWGGLALQPVRIAGPVPPLVRVADDRHDRAEELDGFEDPRPEERVLLHDLPLLGSERTTLREDRRGHADLAQ